MNEPIFSRQEQGVVYLFSRYWEKLDVFKHKEIYDIQMHFPDASMVDNTSGAEEAIEFEYALDAFYAHVPDDLKRLDEYKALYIVYWDHNADERELRKQIKKIFAGKVVLVCLKNYFCPGVERDSDCLRAFWDFPKRNNQTEAYSFREIKEDTNKLVKCGAFQSFKPDKHLYRTICFNKSGSDFIECDHWTNIHYFTTTTRFQKDKIPSRLFVRPSSCQYFFGYFEVELAFVILKGNRLVEDYFRNYYFYPYHQDYQKHTCFVFSRFKELPYRQGVRLFEYLKPKYSLGVRGSLVIEDEHMGQIDRIVA